MPRRRGACACCSREFLRESLQLGSQDRIPLARELKMVERFLEVEKVRFGDRLQVSISDGDAGGCLIAAAPAAAHRRECRDARDRARAGRRDGHDIGIAIGSAAHDRGREPMRFRSAEAHRNRPRSCERPGTPGCAARIERTPADVGSRWCLEDGAGCSH